MKTTTKKRLLVVLALSALGWQAFGASGNWTNNAAGNWSGAANWNPNGAPGTAAGDVVGITANITAARTVTIDTTSRTAGTLNIGDSGSTYYAFTLAASGGATLTFNNSGSSANLVQSVTTAADVISAPLVLADNLSIVTTSGGLTLSGVISGTGKGISKSGSGPLTLSGANTYSGKTEVLAGTLRVSANTSLGAVPAAYTADQLTLNGGNLMNNNSDVVIAANQGITLAAGGGLQAGWSRSLTINSVITGTGGLTILPDATPGPISLNAVNTYTGPTQVGNSTTANSWAWLLVNGSLDAASAVTVITNGLLGGTGTINGSVTVNTSGAVGPGGLGQAGTLTVNNDFSISDAALNMDLANDTTVGAGVNDLLAVNGNLTLRGTITVNTILLNGSLAAGTYRLISYTGTLDASGATLVCSNPQFGAAFDLSTPGQVNMVVANGTPLSLTWSGAQGPYWDTINNNWVNGAAPARFTQGDAVTFDDNGNYINPLGLYQLYLTGPLPAVDTLFPASVSVNTSNNFVMTASGTAGRLGGGMALYKGGTGTLTMAHGNDNLPNIYTGPTVITNGVLKINNARVLGPVTGGAIIATNGGTFDLNAQAMSVKPVTIQGAGFNGQGAVINGSATGQNNALQSLTMTGDATVGGVGRFDLRGNTWDTFLSTGGQPYKLTKLGPQQFSLVSATIDPALGDIDVQQGIFSFELNSTTLGDPSKTLTIRSNATLQFWAATNQMNKQFVFNGGSTTTVNSGSGSNTIVGPITLNADSTLTVGGTSLALYGAVGGAGGLIKAGAQPLYLHTANTYLGNTLINAGTLTLGPAGSIGASPFIGVASGATLDVTPLAGGLSLNTGQTLGGSGAVKGTVTAPAGSTISPGSSPGTLSVTNLVLDSATGIFELGASATTAAASDRVVAGNLAASGVTTLKLVPLGLLDTVNPYTLITNLGTALPSGSEANFAVTSPSRYTFSVVPTDTSAGKAVQVQVSGGAPGSLVWQGNDTANPAWWDTGVTTNWLNGGSSDAFLAGDSVLFDDTAIGTTASLIGLVQPSFIRLANAAKPITINGAGSLSTPSLSGEGGSTTTIANTAGNTFLNGVTNVSGTLTLANTGINSFGVGVQVKGGALNLANTGDNAVGPLTITAGAMNILNTGVNTLGAVSLNGGTLSFAQPLDTTVSSVLSGAGSLVKDGANMLTLSGASPSFSGPIQVNGGILRVGAANALGSIAGGTTIASGATLDVNGINLTNELVTVSGAGVGGLGAIVNSGAGQNNALHNVRLTGDATFGGAGRWDIRTNASGRAVFSTGGQPYNLTKVGANQSEWVDVDVDAALADIDVKSGIFGYEATTAGLGDPTRTLTVRSNATLYFYAATVPLNKRITLEGGSTLSAGSGSANSTVGPITLLDGVANLNAASGITIYHKGQISGPGGFIKGDAGTVILLGTNIFAGNVTNTTGTLILSNSLAVSTNKVLWVNSTTGGSGISGTRVTLAGAITTPTDVWASFYSHTTGDIRSSMYGQAGTNEWSGPIALRGPSGIVNFAADSPNALVVSGSITNDAFAGTMFVRGTGYGEVRGTVSLPNGNFSKTDASTWVVASSGNIWSNTQIAVGSILLKANDALCVSAPLTMGQGDANAAALDLNGFNQTLQTISPIQGTGTRRIGNNSTTSDSLITFAGGATPSVFAGTFVDSLGAGTRKVALKVTSGTLQLGGANTYSGATTVAGGTLALISAGTIAATPVIDVQAGATFDVTGKGASYSLAAGQILKGNGTVNGMVTADSGATISAGASIGALTFTDALIFGAGSTNVAEVDKSAAPAYDVINAASITYGGTLVVNNLGPAIALGDSFKLFNATSYSGAFAAISPAMPGPGLAWDTSTLNVDGTLRVWAPALGGITQLPDGNFRLTLNGVLGQPYSVRASTNLALPLADWSVLSSGTIPSVPFTFDDLTATNYLERYYILSTP